MATVQKAGAKPKPAPIGNQEGKTHPEYLIGASLALGALMICVAVYMGAGNIVQGVGTLNSAGATQVPSDLQPSQQASIDPPDREVTVDFLYADWCPHCQKMKPIVQKMIDEFPPDRFDVRYWSEAAGQSEPNASAVYAKYSQEGYFTGYPTFVVNNGKGHAAGEMSEADFRAWLCTQFDSPKPANCN